MLVVVPTYDEAQSLLALLERLARAVPGAHVLVVDDASPDGTGELAEAAAARDDRVRVLHRAGKEGLGAAYRAGLAHGLASDQGYRVLVEMDADGSHAPEQLPALLAALGGEDGAGGGADGADGADLVLGSRWVRGGSVVDWPWWRQALSRGGTLYARALLGLPVRDATGGFRAYRRAALEALDVGSTDTQGYCFQVDLVRRAHDAGLRVVEVPITFVERAAGRSKMDGAVVAEALWRVTGWGAARLGRRARAAAGAARALRPGRRTGGG